MGDLLQIKHIELETKRFIEADDTERVVARLSYVPKSNFARSVRG